MHKCDFCGKEQDKVNRMVAGNSVDICDGCILTCMQILMETTKDKLNSVNNRIEFNKDNKNENISE